MMLARRSLIFGLPLGLPLGLTLGVVVLAACTPEPAQPVKASSKVAPSVVEAGEAGEGESTQPQPQPQPFAPPDTDLIRFACAGFDAAVEAGAPPARLLSHSAAHAVELGGPEVERATRRWALLPPEGLVEEIDRWERRSGADPSTCAGLRAHLERMAILAGSH